jgi:hypothetical protein
MNMPPYAKWQIAILGAAALVSAIIGYLSGIADSSFSWADRLIVGLIVFVVFELLDLLMVTASRDAKETKQVRLWELGDKGDVILSNIRTRFHEVVRQSYGPRDLFVGHFIHEFERLLRIGGEAADRQELRVRAEHLLNVDNVLDAFEGEADRVFRYTWRLDEGTRLFDLDLAWARYFEKTGEMAACSELKEIRALLIVEDPSAIHSPRILKLLDAFATNSGMKCRLVSEGDYEKVYADSDLSRDCVDFGIYGDKLLFLSDQYDPDVTGIFTKQLETISRYKKMFDSLWTANSISSANPSTCGTKVTLAELFAFDKDQPLT